MKRYKRVANIFGAFLAALAVIFTQYSAMAATVDRTVSVVGQAAKPVTPGPILDDFRYAAPVNVWSCSAGTFSKSSIVPPPSNESCTASYTGDPAITHGGSGYSMKLDYDVSQTASSLDGKPTFAGYYSRLGSASLAGYTAVSFYVKGAIGGEFFKIEISNNSSASYLYTNPYDPSDQTHYYRNRAPVYITDYLDGGVTTSWSKVTIPLGNFVNLDDWNSMKELVFVFENSQITLNSGAGTTHGTVYIDDIVFETGAVDAVRVDYFGDKIGVSALGGAVGTMYGDGGSASAPVFSATRYDPDSGPRSLGVGYDVTTYSGSWAGAYIIFGGGVTDNTVEKPDKGGFIPISHDFSAYDCLTFRILANSGNPKNITVEAEDAGGKQSRQVSGISDTLWQTYRIYLVDAPGRPGFIGLNPATLKQVNFVLSNDVITSAAGNTRGVVYIDSIRFEKRP